MSKIGFIAFILGFILAVAAGIIAAANGHEYTAIVVILIILGVLIGLLNVTHRETVLFLVATIAFIVGGNVFGPLTVLSVGNYLGHILGYIAALMTPAAVVVAFKALWNVSKPGETNRHNHK